MLGLNGPQSPRTFCLQREDANVQAHQESHSHRATACHPHRRTVGGTRKDMGCGVRHWSESQLCPSQLSAHSWSSVHTSISFSIKWGEWMSTSLNPQPGASRFSSQTADTCDPQSCPPSWAAAGPWTENSSLPLPEGVPPWPQLQPGQQARAARERKRGNQGPAGRTDQNMASPSP